VHRRSNLDVQADRPATELQLQQFSGFVVTTIARAVDSTVTYMGHLFAGGIRPKTEYHANIVK